MRKIILFLSIILAFWGCSNDNDLLDLGRLYKEEAPLQIITRVLTTKSTGFIQEFPQGATIGLHITSGRVGDLYNGITDYKNVKAVASLLDTKEIDWEQIPEIHINSKKATIYAYSPYQEGVDFNAGQIPVKIASQAEETNDYMYGTHAIGQKAVSNTSPVVLLSMNHALSLISFQIKRTKDQKGAFIVSSVQLGNKPGGTALVGEGTLDISTGNITGSTINTTSSSTRLSLSNPITLLSTYCDPLQVMVIPTQATDEGEIEALFTINGQVYTYQLPANIQWIKGKKYVYELSFNSRSLQLQNVSTTAWSPGSSVKWDKI